MSLKDTCTVGIFVITYLVSVLQITHLKLSFEEKLRGLVPSSVRQVLYRKKKSASEIFHELKGKNNHNGLMSFVNFVEDSGHNRYHLQKFPMN